MPSTLAETLAARAQDKVMESLKIIASTCYPIRILCGCDAAMATTKPSDYPWCKRIWCCMIFEVELLNKDPAQAYNGVKASHDIFTTAEGMSPERFIRQQIQESIMKHFMAPSGKLNDTIEAMLELWMARNKQWREMYGSLDITRQKWSNEAYPDAPLGHAFPKEALPAGA